MPTRYWPPPKHCEGGFRSPKINHDGVKSRRKLSRTDAVSDRRGSADVVPFGSIFRISSISCAGSRKVWSAPPSCDGTIAPCEEWLHHPPRRQAGPVWPRGVLDPHRHGHRAWRLVGGNGHLFRISRRRADTADRASGGYA